MKYIFVLIISAYFLYANPYIPDFKNTPLAEKYQPVAEKIFEAIHKDTSAWERLAYLCDTFGPRLSGSQNLENALDWIEKSMVNDGLNNVQRQKVMVPHWVRNEESITLLEPHKRKLIMLSLGGSVGTPEGGITSEVFVVKSYDDLRSNKDKVKGKVVLYDLDWEGYGPNVQYRIFGADSASKYGAIASMIRSVSNHGLQIPHTGVMFYNEEFKKIPHLAITMEESMMMKRMQDRGQKIVVHIEMNAETLPDAESSNVWGEITGTEYPNKYIALGGHIDSWDVGTGAMDDGSGCVAGWEAIMLLKELNLIPKHTARAVMWANEENGSMGGKEYAKKYDSASHVLMLEFDSGVYMPKAIGFTGPDSMFVKLKSVESLFKRVNPEFEFRKGGGGVDIRAMMQQGVPGMGVWGDSKGMYFQDHHSPTDMVDKVDAQTFNDCIGVMALVIYIYSDLVE